MSFKTLTASILASLVIVAPAVAKPNWKVFGRSNGGSEIALDNNSFNQSGNTVYFVYRITKNNKPFYHKGRTTDCFVGDSGQTNGHPQLWQSIDNPAEPVNVSADSLASQNMLINVCRKARAVAIETNTRQQSLSGEEFNESCSSTFKQGRSETTINCYRAVVTEVPENPDRLKISALHYLVCEIESKSSKQK